MAHGWRLRAASCLSVCHHPLIIAQQLWAQWKCNWGFLWQILWKWWYNCNIWKRKLAVLWSGTKNEGWEASGKSNMTIDLCLRIQEGELQKCTQVEMYLKLYVSTIASISRWMSIFFKLSSTCFFNQGSDSTKPQRFSLCGGPASSQLLTSFSMQRS